MIVRDTVAMIAGMKPEVIDGEYVFCTTRDPELTIRCQPAALGMFRERDGTTFILTKALAEENGFDCATPMRWITLNVYSALDGVGLTAAVARALADRGIPCNMVAAYHHDNVFIPADMVDEALAALQTLSLGAA